MEKNYWFRRRKYGYGLSPAGWRGWLVTVGFVALVMANAYRLDAASHSASDTIRPFLIETAVLCVVFVAIVFLKGERPLRWQWGKKEKDL